MQIYVTAPSGEAERDQIELLRQIGLVGRATLAMSLSHVMIDFSRAAIRLEHPAASQEERGLICVATHYGAELAEQL